MVLVGDALRTGGLGHKAALGVREVDGKLAWRQVRLLEGQIDDRRTGLVGDPCSRPAGAWACRPPDPRARRPKRRTRNSDRRQSSPDGQRRLFHSLMIFLTPA